MSCHRDLSGAVLLPTAQHPILARDFVDMSILPPEKLYPLRSTSVSKDCVVGTS